jgi:hypothetical protein
MPNIFMMNPVQRELGPLGYVYKHKISAAKCLPNAKVDFAGFAEHSVIAKEKCHYCLKT